MLLAPAVSPRAEVEPMKGSTGGGTELHIAGAGFAYVTQVGALGWWYHILVVRVVGGGPPL